MFSPINENQHSSIGISHETSLQKNPFAKIITSAYKSAYRYLLLSFRLLIYTSCTSSQLLVHVCSAGDRTQGIVHTQKASYH